MLSGAIHCAMSQVAPPSRVCPTQPLEPANRTWPGPRTSKDRTEQGSSSEASRALVLATGPREGHNEGKKQGAHGVGVKDLLQGRGEVPSESCPHKREMKHLDTP